MSLNISNNDFNDPEKVAELFRNIDTIDEHYVKNTGNEMFQNQPFMLSEMLGYHYEVNPIELEEIMKVYFIIWDCFKEKKNIKKMKLTEGQFAKLTKRNIDFFNYLDGEVNEEDYKNTTIIDLNNIKSKTLLAGILVRFNNRPALVSMEKDIKGMVLVGVKSIIEGLEELIEK